MALSARSRVRARLLNTWAVGRGAAPSAPVGDGGLAFSKLVYPETALWSDATAPGGVLSALRDFQTGAGYTVELIAMNPTVPTPPADAVTVSGGNYVAGPGFAALVNDTYIMDTTNVLSGKVSRTFVDILSRESAVVVASAGALTTALGDIAATISGNGSAFTGAVIELAAGVNFGDVTITQFPAATLTAMAHKVVIRGPATGARPIIRRLTISGQRCLRFQQIDRRWDTTLPNATALDSVTGAVGCSFLQTDFIGGRVVYDASGVSSYDPNTPVDFDNPFQPGYTYFQSPVTGGVYGQIDLYRGQLGDFQSGAALGVWQPADVPSYMGQNFTNAAIVSGTRPAAPGQSCILAMQPRMTGGTGFDAQFEVAWLDSTPRNLPQGGINRTKPGPVNGQEAPDGLYVTAWVRVSNGTGYTTVPANLSNPRGTLTWAGRVNGLDAPQLVAGNAAIDMTYSRCRWSGIAQGHRFSFRDGEGGGISFLGCVHDGGYSDMQSHSINGTVLDRFVNYRSWFSVLSRGLSRADDWNNQHGDLRQFFQASSGGVDGARDVTCQIVGDVMWNAGTRGLVQGDFYTNLRDTSQNKGYYLTAIGVLYAPNNANGLVTNETGTEIVAYSQISTGLGISSITPGQRYVVAGKPQKLHREKTLAQSLRISAYPALAPGGFAEQQFLDQRVTTLTDAALHSAPSAAWLGTTEWGPMIDVLRSRFTPIGANVGWGPFADPTQIIDHKNYVFDPNAVPFRTLLPPKVGVAVSTATASDAAINWGRKSSTLSAISGGEYSIGVGATPALARADALNGPWLTAVPATIPENGAIAFRTTSSAFATSRTFVTYTLDGVEQTWFARTGTTGPLPPPEPEAQPTLSAATTNSGGATSSDPITPIPVGSPISVPDRGLLLVVVGQDDDPLNWALRGDTDWELLAYARGNNAADQDELRVFAYKNRTGAAVNKSLEADMAVGNTFPQHWSAVRFLFAPTAANLVVDCIASPAATGFGTAPNAPAVDLDANRNFTAIAAMVCDNAETPSDPTGLPSGMGGTRLGVAGHAATAAAVSVWTARQQLTNNTIDPSAFTIGAARSWAAATVAVFQRPA